MTARGIARAVARQIIPPPDVRAFLVEAVVPTAADIERLREAVLVVIVAVAIVALLLGRSS